MEEYAVTYEKIALNGYQIEHILSLEMQENVNDHGKLHLTAVISEELAEQYVYTTTPMMPVTLSYQSDNGMTPLCHGIGTHDTIFSYIRLYRITQASKLLRETGLSVEDIATECGFASASYFISAFKRCLKTTPLRYRNGA